MEFVILQSCFYERFKNFLLKYSGNCPKKSTTYAIDRVIESLIDVGCDFSLDLSEPDCNIDIDKIEIGEEDLLVCDNLSKIIENINLAS